MSTLSVARDALLEQATIAGAPSAAAPTTLPNCSGGARCSSRFYVAAGGKARNKNAEPPTP